MLAAISAVLHGFSLADVASLASGALLVAMIVMCLNGTASAVAGLKLVIAAAVVYHRKRVDPERVALLTRVHRGVLSVIVLACAGVIAVAAAERVGAEAGATDVITVAAVAGNGQPINGYHVVNRQPSANLSGCPGASPAAVGNDIYACDPSEAAAEVCWPAPASVLCLADPWTKSLRRLPSPGALPAVDPVGAPRPFAMVLDDGTRCILPNGIDLGGRADGTVPIYGCGQNLSVGVLAPPDWNPGDAIDRTQPLWAVYVGQLGPRDTPFQPPIRHTVRTAWFAGNAGG